MNQYRLYQTTYEDFDLRIQNSNYLINSTDALKLVDITISLFGKIELKEFDNIEEGLGYNLNKGLNYKFIELKQDNGVGFFYVAENNTFDKKAYITRAINGIGKKWNLYLNAWDHIYAQGIGSVRNSGFNFVSYRLKYSYMSILLYTITHVEHEDLEKEFDENKKII